MTLASPWLLAAMSENGTPSASRFAMVCVLVLLAPLVLVCVIRFVPAAVGECFIAWVLAACGAYVGRGLSFLNRNSTTTSTAESTVTTTRTPPEAP